METFWFFRLRFRRAYDSAYDFHSRFSLGYKRSYDSDSVASENQLLKIEIAPVTFRTPLENGERALILFISWHKWKLDAIDLLSYKIVRKKMPNVFK